MAKILLGVTGSIAAYRSPDLIKALIAKEHEVQSVITQSASQFVTAKTLETFSGKKVLSNDSWDENHEGTDHIKHARWADVFVVYGATANFMAKLAGGFCDDFLSLQILSSKVPVVLVPAMNVEMWKNSATQENYKKLLARGFQFVGPIAGTLACGEVGEGHVADLGEIVFSVENLVTEKNARTNPTNYFQGRDVLVSLGSMKTNIDDVRFLQNKSSGRMGIEIAKCLTQLGAKVQLLAGLVEADVEIEFSAFSFERFRNYQEYQEKLKLLFRGSDVFLSLAAVLDFEVKAVSGKLERGIEKLSLDLIPTQDMVAWAVGHKESSQKIIAFSLESAPSWPECLERAQRKLLKKKADLIVVNRSGVDSEGPDSDTNSFYLLTPNGESKEFPLAGKGELAWKLCKELAAYFQTEAKSSGGFHGLNSEHSSQ